MLLFHVILLPFVLGVLVVWHVLLVRRHGVVPPFADESLSRDADAATAESTRPPAADEPAVEPVSDEVKA
jgi:ubiquinol-cytochrome c reductase cytochrome b subunit